MAKLKPFARISLRYSLVLFTVACLWAGKVSIDARRQKAAVEWVESHGGLVRYDWQIDPQTSKLLNIPNPTPAWIRRILGDDCFQTVNVVGITNQSNLRDFSRLAELPDTKFLQIIAAPLSDLSFLAELPHIETLMLRDCEIVDIGPLAQLNKLKTLAVDNNRVIDLTPLRSVRSLSTLTCSNNQIRDLSPISKLSSLVAIDSGNNPISDLSPLATLPSLDMVRFNECEITDCSPLMRVPTLFVADLSDNAGLDEEENLKLQRYISRPRD